MSWSGWLQRHTSTSRALTEAASSLPVWPQLPTRLFIKRIHRVHKEQPEASKWGWQSSQSALPGIHNFSRMGMCSVGVGLGGWALCNGNSRKVWLVQRHHQIQFHAQMHTMHLSPLPSTCLGVCFEPPEPIAFILLIGGSCLCNVLHTTCF